MQGPDPLQTVIQGLLVSVGKGVPDVDDIILTGGEDDWDVGVEGDSGDVVDVAIIKGEEALLGLVVPHFHLAIVTSRHEVRSFMIMTEVNTVDTSLMAMQTEIGIALRR